MHWQQSCFTCVGGFSCFQWMTETRLLLIWKITNNVLNQNIVALKLIRLFLIALKYASMFPGLLLKCRKRKWIVSGRKYATYFTQPTIMSFFRAVWKSLMKDCADGCCAGKTFPQQHLPCPSLSRSAAELGTQHQPLPPAPWRIMTSTYALTVSPRMVNIRLFILDWQQVIRPFKKKILEKKQSTNFECKSGLRGNKCHHGQVGRHHLAHESGHWARQLLSTAELGPGPTPAPRPCWGFCLLEKTTCKARLHVDSCSTAQKLVWERRSVAYDKVTAPF